MKSIRLIVLFIFLSSATAFSQSLSRVNSGIDLGLGYQDKEWVPSVMYHQELNLNNFSWFRIGWGVRTWGYYAGKTNLLPQNNALSNDTLKFGRITANGLSFLVGANIRLWKIDIGANTDLLGFAFGVKRRGLYSKPTFYEGQGAPFYNAYVESKPTMFNVLPLVMEKQSGQSELFLRFWITDRVGVKLGYVHGRMTYMTESKLDNGQKHFSKTYGVPYAGLSFPLYN
ncbi:hypothetical protein [Dyadobacter pollutisoli]|jgi:hypothetical protein|uniref:DUF3575 domain-containing protein n=1 Tax=Dyadobacter pollutisoli TaxID=2910158 RepID=A0A9E8SMR3_9BACT|nr:hypothetical protein [Dyadobacter pollutisoli]WAC15045.1 hypothetical protein ON006_13980 [Dyadobacter pollutisoli]